MESRTLLSWGTIPQLINQDVAVQQYPTVTGVGEVIVDIDSGVDFNHPTLSGQWWLNPGEIANNGKDDDGNGLVDDTRGWNFYDGNNDATDEVGHGTQTSGIIAAKPWTYATNIGGDGATYQGIAPGVKILPIKVSTPTEASPAFDQHVGQALDYVVWLVQNHPEYHIVAVNLSLGAYSTQTFQQFEQTQVEALHDLGVFVAAAAGNGNDFSNVIYPANDPKVYAIAGVNPDGQLTAHSNRGAKVALLAPGNLVPILQKGSTFLTSGDGTSYATPFVTAAAALVKQVDPGLNPDEILSVLQRSGVDTYDSESGLTFKRLDVAAAIALAYQESGGPMPFNGTPATVPGYIQAEQFDNGGESIGYHDADSVNTTGSFRSSGVDLERSSEKGFDVTLTGPGEWLAYSFNVSATGTYDLQTRIASKRGGGTYRIKIDGHNVSGTVTTPRTGGWQTYTTLTTSGISLASGNHLLRVLIDSGGPNGYAGNFNWFRFVATVGKGHHHTARAGAMAMVVSTGTQPKSLYTVTVRKRSWLAAD